MTDKTGYVLDNSHVEVGERFEALSRLFDPWTLRHVDALGTRTGWRCWEVGAGGPNVPGQLAARVGEQGSGWNVRPLRKDRAMTRPRPTTLGFR